MWERERARLLRCESLANGEAEGQVVDVVPACVVVS